MPVPTIGGPAPAQQARAAVSGKVRQLGTGERVAELHLIYIPAGDAAPTVLATLTATFSQGQHLDMLRQGLASLAAQLPPDILVPR